MKENELKCKLEEMAAGMGYEIKEKFKKEIDPIYKVFQLLIIFGFLTVFTIMGTYLTISLSNNNKVICTDKKEIFVPMPMPIITEKIVVKVIEKTEGLTYFKTVIRNNREYKYYKKVQGETWEFYTVATEIKGKSCK